VDLVALEKSRERELSGSADMVPVEGTVDVPSLHGGKLTWATARNNVRDHLIRR
jgi:hypothetical protein